MAYTAMARKWRPQNFNELTGQEHVAQTIENAITGDRLHHAFLFTGTRGVGKTSSARILAKTLNCPNREGLIPCGTCDACITIAKGTSLDVLELDGASNNSVEDIRELIEQVKYPPINGEYKIFVIDEVHMLSKSAFNALLKTLEEPPPHVIFIFATTEINKVPQTILSRIQRFDFKRLSQEKIAGRLSYICQQEEIQIDEDTLNLISEKADGSMRDALTLFDQVYSFSGKDMNIVSTQKVLGAAAETVYIDTLKAVKSKSLDKCFEIVKNIYDDGIELGEFIKGFIKVLRNLIFMKTSGIDPTQIDVSPQSAELLKEVVGDFEHGDLLRISKMILDLEKELKNHSQHRIILEITLSKLCYLDSVVDLRKLIAQIPALKDQQGTDSEVKKKL